MYYNQQKRSEVKEEARRLRRKFLRYRYTEPRIEDVIDEMIAILSDREEFIKKKEMEQAQAVINEIYRNGL